MATHKKPSLRTILSEATHVITSNPRHFFILSLMFLFPISISNLVLPVLRISASTTQNPHLSVFVVVLFSIVLSLCTAPSITYSAYLAYYDRPVTIITSLKAVLKSFFPVLATFIATQMLFGLILLAYVGLSFLLYGLLVLIGVDMDGSNLIIFVVLMTSLLLIPLAYIGLNLCLSNAVVVMESKWGFAPLKRSSYLVKGTSGKLFRVMILFGSISSLISLVGTRVAANAGGRFTSWEFLLQMTILAVFLTLASLYSMVTVVVMYVHCKEVHGEFELSDSKSVISGGKYEQVSSGIDLV